MTEDESRQKVAEHWLNKANEALESAESEYRMRRFDFAVNRAYYACFYAASAVLLLMGRKFVKTLGCEAQYINI